MIKSSWSFSVRQVARWHWIVIASYQGTARRRLVVFGEGLHIHEEHFVASCDRYDRHSYTTWRAIPAVARARLRAKLQNPDHPCSCAACYLPDGARQLTIFDVLGGKG